MNAYANIIAVLERGTYEEALDRAEWLSEAGFEARYTECAEDLPAVHARIWANQMRYARWAESEFAALRGDDLYAATERGTPFSTHDLPF